MATGDPVRPGCHHRPSIQSAPAPAATAGAQAAIVQWVAVIGEMTRWISNRYHREWTNLKPHTDTAASGHARPACTSATGSVARLRSGACTGRWRTQCRSGVVRTGQRAQMQFRNRHRCRNNCNLRSIHIEDIKFGHLTWVEVKRPQPANRPTGRINTGHAATTAGGLLQLGRSSYMHKISGSHRVKIRTAANLVSTATHHR